MAFKGEKSFMLCPMSGVVQSPGWVNAKLVGEKTAKKAMGKLAKKAVKICKKIVGADKKIVVADEEGEKWKYNEYPAPGDHIRVRRGRLLNLDPCRALLVVDKHGANLYEHHGIYIGNDTVIHFSSPDDDALGEVKVRKTTLKGFINGGFFFEKLFGKGKIEVRNFKAVNNKARFPKAEVVKRAKAALKRQRFGTYNLLTNNCEHFANYCVFGKKFSEQAGGKEPVAKPRAKKKAVAKNR